MNKIYYRKDLKKGDAILCAHEEITFSKLGGPKNWFLIFSPGNVDNKVEKCIAFVLSNGSKESKVECIHGRQQSMPYDLVYLADKESVELFKLRL